MILVGKGKQRQNLYSPFLFSEMCLLRTALQLRSPSSTRIWEGRRSRTWSKPHCLLREAGASRSWVMGHSLGTTTSTQTRLCSTRPKRTRRSRTTLPWPKQSRMSPSPCPLVQRVQEALPVMHRVTLQANLMPRAPREQSRYLGVRLM